MNTFFIPSRRVKRLLHALADVFLVNWALGYLWDIQVAYEAVADFNSLGAVFAGSLGFVDEDFLHKFLKQWGRQGIHFQELSHCL